MRRLILLGLLPLGLFAQLQIVLFKDGAETPLKGLTELGNTPMGDFAETRFRARNNTNAAISLQSVRAEGTAFSLTDRPTLPYIVAPGAFAEFRVTFTPAAPGSYSASLVVNGGTWLLRATSTAAPTLVVLNPEGPPPLVTPGSPIDFGRVQKKRSIVRSFRLSNTTSAPLQINNVSVSGLSFKNVSVLAFPTGLAPAASIEFQISFEPKSSGQHVGSIKIDERSFALQGTAFEPPLPAANITISGPATSGTQPKVAVQFAEIPETSGSGSLFLDFRPTVPNTTDDPAIMFTATGSRRLTVQVTEGDATAVFGTLKEVPFQTGTTAGILTFTLQIGDYSLQKTITVEPAPVSIDTSSALRRVNDLDVSITGYDNTRSAGRFGFRFYDRAGTLVPPGVIPVDVTADFGRYFAISRVGGSFLLRATFPVTGDASQIGAVEVELTNSAGSVKTSRLELK